jgi:RHS repeat-associated protein
MGKIKKMITGAAAIFLCGMAVYVSGETCLAAGDTYDTALESVYGDSFRSMYYDKLSGSPLEAESPDGVDTANGHLILSRTDLCLEGTGGMGFELNRYYNSNEAGIGHPTVEYLDKIDVDTVYLKYETQSGEYYDKETEEIYLRARYYQMAVGRFLTRDSYTGEEDEPLSLHLYTYCENDGVNAWDPSGHVIQYPSGMPSNVYNKYNGCIKRIGKGKWCELYSKKSYSGGRIVKIPSDNPDRNGWNSCEYPSQYQPINPYVSQKTKNAIEIKKKNSLRVTKTGKTKKGPRYAVAVGPVVLSKKFSNKNIVANYKKIDFSKCYGKELDAEIKKGRKKYYIRCVEGDTKAHTYPNGVYQTGVSYEDTSKKIPDLTPAVIEFIGNVVGKNAELNKYKINKVIVYDNKKIG